MVRFTAMILACIGLAACGDERAATNSDVDRAEVVPFKSTLVLSETDLADLAVDDSDGSLSLPAGAPVIPSLQPGRILVAGKSPNTPHGLLRVVKATQPDGERLRIETRHIPIQLAFRRVHIAAARRSTGQLGATKWDSARDPLSYDPFHRHVGASQALDVIIFDGDNNPDTTNDQISVKGELAGSVDFDFKLDFDWGELEDLPSLVEQCLGALLEGQFDCSLLALLPEAKATLNVTPSLASSLDVRGASVLDFDKEVKLFESNLGEMWFGPVVFTPNVRILSHVQGAASASFAQSFDAAVYFDTSVTVSSKQPNTPVFDPPKLRDVSFDARPPELTLKANARAALGVELNLLLYGVTGPSAKAEAYGAIDADAFRDPCVQLHAGVEGTLGVKITTPAFLFINPFDLIDWHTEFRAVDQLLDVPVPECKPAAADSRLPPGAGPDAEHIANPTFQPWSRTFASLLDSAGSIPGGTTYWLDQRRAIDGRLVITGKAAAAIIKIDENGNQVWARQLFSDATSASALHPVRSIPTGDASLLVLTEAGLPPLRVTKLTQSGNLLWNRALDIPDAVGCGLKPIGLARDSGTGFYVVTGCSFTRQLHVTHLDLQGNVLDAVSIADLDAAQLETTLVTSAGQDLFIAGRISLPAGGDSMFALRRAADGSLKFAHRYVACDAGPDVFPVRALVEDNGDVTVVGRGGAEHNGFIARIQATGDVGFAAFPGFGFGVGSVFVLDSIAQLSTTGYMVSGSTVQFTSSAPNDVAGLALLQLDSVGKPVWANRYTIQDSAGNYLASAQSDLALTDDGGVILSGIAQQAPSAIPADLWSMKARARDGQIEFASGKAVVTPISVAALSCTLAAVPWSPTVQSAPLVTTTDAQLQMRDWNTTLQSQAH